MYICIYIFIYIDMYAHLYTYMYVRTIPGLGLPGLDLELFLNVGHKSVDNLSKAIYSSLTHWPTGQSQVALKMAFHMTKNACSVNPGSNKVNYIIFRS